MAVIAHPALTKSQPLSVRPWFGGLADALRVWHRRVRERRALANLSERELADFGATTADVYRELSAPFWRAPPPC
jgi:uncharacterized protein YjiS (DUF1127 family)